MIITARQLESMHREGGGNGSVTLPYRARLTPLAADLIRARKLLVGYSDVDGLCGSAKPAQSSQASCTCGCGSCPDVSATPTVSFGASASQTQSAGTSRSLLWWCDGASGPAKAALSGDASRTVRPLDFPADARRIVAVIKSLAFEVKASRAAGGLLLVQNGALAMVYANRCSSLRAVLGTSLDALEQGLQQVSANVLVIEYPRKTLLEMRNLIHRFSRGAPALSEEARQNFAELIACG